jgi:hypothetical protein
MQPQIQARAVFIAFCKYFECRRAAWRGCADRLNATVEQGKSMLLLLALVIAGIVYLLVSNKDTSAMKQSTAPAAESGPKPPGRHVPVLPADVPALHWQDGGRYQMEVVAESVYAETVKRLAGPHGDARANMQLRALLMPDDDYPFDDKAVAVFIEGELVGYLAKEDASRFRRKLDLKDLNGKVSSTDAAIRGGGVWNGKRLSYAVWLDIDPFD